MFIHIKVKNSYLKQLFSIFLEKILLTFPITARNTASFLPITKFFSNSRWIGGNKLWYLGSLLKGHVEKAGTTPGTTPGTSPRDTSRRCCIVCHCTNTGNVPILLENFSPKKEKLRPFFSLFTWVFTRRCFTEKFYFYKKS